jgi:hypothetical protein
MHISSASSDEFLSAGSTAEEVPKKNPVNPQAIFYIQ